MQFIFQLLTFLFAKANQIYAEVVCGMETNLAVFGQPLDLFCELLNDTVCVEQKKRFWMGGDGSKVLAINGKPAGKKYRETVPSCKKIILTIGDLSESDVGHDYRCFLDFQSCKIPLNLSSGLFEYRPNNNDIEKEVNTSSIISLDIKIPKVYPAPECVLFLDNKERKAVTRQNITKNGMLYMAEIQMKYKFPSMTCPLPIKLTCSIGTTNVTMLDSKLENCTGFGRVSSFFEKSLLDLIICIIFGVFCLISLVLSLIRNQNGIRTTYKSLKQRTLWGLRRPIIAIILTVLLVALWITTDVIAIDQLIQREDNAANSVVLCALSVVLTPFTLCFISNPDTEGIRKGFITALSNFNDILRGNRRCFNFQCNRRDHTATDIPEEDRLNEDEL